MIVPYQHSIHMMQSAFILLFTSLLLITQDAQGFFLTIQRRPQQNQWSQRHVAGSPHQSITALSRFHKSTLYSSSNNSNKTPHLDHDQIARYSRHLVLADVGMTGQLKLQQAAVLVIGAGGLGSPCLLYLAAAGVGNIGIVDADVVDTSNLQRQIIHGTSTVGVSKCESAAARMRDVNPHVNIRLYEEEYTAETAMRILQGGFSDDKTYDVVVDGSDNFPTKYLINDSCAIAKIPWIYSAILAFEGQVATFNVPMPKSNDSSGDGSVVYSPDYRDLLPVPPPPGDVPSCAEGGVLGVLPGTCGCIQATEVIKLLLGRTGADELLIGRVLVYDAMKMKFTQVGLNKYPDRQVINELVDYQGFCGAPQSSSNNSSRNSQKGSSGKSATATGRTMDESEEAVLEATTATATSITKKVASFHTISPTDAFQKLVDTDWSPFVLDVRLQTEHEICALPFTDHLRTHRTVSLADIPETGDVLVYCKAGIRGQKACQKLIQEYNVEPERLYNLQGGLMQWQKDVDPSMPRY